MFSVRGSRACLYVPKVVAKDRCCDSSATGTWKLSVMSRVLKTVADCTLAAISSTVGICVGSGLTYLLRCLKSVVSLTSVTEFFLYVMIMSAQNSVGCVTFLIIPDRSRSSSLAFTFGPSAGGNRLAGAQRLSVVLALVCTHSPFSIGQCLERWFES